MAKLTYTEIEHALKVGRPLTATLTKETRGIPAGTEVAIDSVGNPHFNQIQCRVSTQLFIAFSDELNIEIDDQTAEEIQEGSNAHLEKIYSDFPSSFSVSEEVPVLIENGMLTPLKVGIDTELVECHAKLKEEGKEIVVVESHNVDQYPWVFYTIYNFSKGIDEIGHYQGVRRSRFYREQTNHAIYMADVEKLKAYIKK